MFQLVNILLVIEGLFSGLVNLTIFSMIVNHHDDIWFEEQRRFVSSFEDLTDVALNVKMKFLEMHDFTLLSDICPRKIRNAVAYNDFTIDSDGAACIQGEKFPLRRLTEIVVRMNRICAKMILEWSERLTEISRNI
jgi:hypothetical protein